MIRTSLLLASVLAFASACSSEASSKTSFQTAFSANTDDGTPLEGVEFFTGKSRLGVTGPAGRFTVQLTGAPGASLPVETRCPEAYESPSSDSLRLARVKSLGKNELRPLEHSSTCTRKTRDLVMVVHAERGEHLPVLVDGEVVGKTDELGNAHIRIEVERHREKVTVSLDTSSSPILRPENPLRVFSPEGRDVIALFEQSFSEAKRARRTTKQTTAARRHVPYRVN